MPASTLAQRIIAELEPALGRHTAQRALSLVCEKTGREPGRLGPADLESVRAILLPMLRTLLGRVKAEEVLQRLGTAD